MTRTFLAFLAVLCSSAAQARTIVELAAPTVIPYTLVLRDKLGKTMLIRNIRGKEACEQIKSALSYSADIETPECFK